MKKENTKSYMISWDDHGNHISMMWYEIYDGPIERWQNNSFYTVTEIDKISLNEKL